MSRVFELSVDADLENLKEVRSFFNHAGESLGVEKNTLGDLCLVVDEAVTNVILHGYEGRDGVVSVQVERDEDAVVICIRDKAKFFDGSHVKTPQLKAGLSERAFGGMGVYLIKKLTDEAEFRALPDQGNELRLVKRGAFI